MNFRKGILNVTGKILIIENDVYLSVNDKTNNETRFKLSGNMTEVIKKNNNSNAEIIIKLNKKVSSSLAEAEFIELINLKEPYEKQVYYEFKKELNYESY